MLGEKIAKTGIRREAGLFYYIHRGDIWATTHEGVARRVALAGIEEDNVTYSYYVDEDGDVARRKRAVRGESNHEGTNSQAVLHAHLDVLRAAVERVDALAALAAAQFDGRNAARSDPAQMNRMGHLIKMIAEAAGGAVVAVAALDGLCVVPASGGSDET